MTYTLERVENEIIIASYSVLFYLAPYVVSWHKLLQISHAIVTYYIIYGHDTHIQMLNQASLIYRTVAHFLNSSNITT
jgi:hypothetical protein